MIRVWGGKLLFCCTRRRCPLSGGHDKVGSGHGCVRFLMREVQLAEHFSEEFVQDVLGVFAAEVALDNERERE